MRRAKIYTVRSPDRHGTQTQVHAMLAPAAVPNPRVLRCTTAYGIIGVARRVHMHCMAGPPPWPLQKSSSAPATSAPGGAPPFPSRSRCDRSIWHCTIWYRYGRASHARCRLHRWRWNHARGGCVCFSSMLVHRWSCLDKKFLDFNIISLSFLFNKHYPIIE